MGKDELIKKIKNELGFVFRAISEDDPLDFIVYLQPSQEDDDNPRFFMWPTPYQNIVIEITSMEEEPEQWVVGTSNQTWYWRKVDPDRVKRFSAAMREAGFEIG